MRGPALPMLAAVALSLAACGGVDQLAAGPKGVVAEVRSGDAVVLRGGQVVRLVGIEAPKGDDAFAGQARDALSRLVLGQEVQLMFGGARQDAYGRTLAHLKLTRGDVWVEQALIRAGDVRVHTYPDNRALGRVMLDDEARARQAKRGLWGLRDYQVRLPDEAAAKPRTATASASAWSAGSAPRSPQTPRASSPPRACV
jgi:endonuclease YncB( thermonuclease family)